MDRESEIIVAQITVGKGAVGVIRLSGADSHVLVNRVFTSVGGGKIQKPRFAYFGKLIDIETNAVLDEVVAVWMKTPHSFTGEDVVEISCHGNQSVLAQVMRLFIRLGARDAGPGEFSKRAYLNGKMDLSQAEAVCDLINAESEAMAGTALKQLDGALSRIIIQLREKLLGLMTEIEAGFDFSEEDVLFFNRKSGIVTVAQVRDGIQKLLDSFQTGKLLRQGIRVALAGKPNVGKSSLLNALLVEDKAIITPIAGTTRDIIQGERQIGGIQYHFFDTAGVRETDDVVEKEGIRRTQSAIESSDYTLFIVDGSLPPSLDDEMLFDRLDFQKTIVVQNKSDLPQDDEWRFWLGKRKISDSRIIALSAKNQTGLDSLLFILENNVKSRWQNQLAHGYVLNNVRHHQVLLRVLQSLGEIYKVLENKQINIDEECLMEDFRMVVALLSSIIGDIDSEAVLDEIFSKFCIGK